MSVRRILCACLVAVWTLLGGVAVAQAAEAPRPAYDVLTVEGFAGSGLLASGNRELTSPAVTAAQQQVTWQATADAETWTATLAAAGAAVLEPGTFAFSTTDVGLTLDIRRDALACVTATGVVTISELTRDAASQVVDSLTATYTYSCQGEPAIAGELRYQSTVDYLRFGIRSVDTASAGQAVTVASGGADQTYSALRLDSDSFRISSDTCTGRTVPAGQSCEVRVVARPRLLAQQAGTVRLEDGSPDGRVVVTMTVGAQDTRTGTYVSRRPARILDTRTGAAGNPVGKMGSGQTITMSVLGKGGVPTSGVSAVVVNLTATQTTAAGYLTVYPAGGSRPVASSINFPPGWTGANQVTVPVGSGGGVSIYNRVGSTHVIADVLGYYVSGAAGGGGEYQLVTSERLLDTRDGSIGGRLPGGYYVTIPVDYGAANTSVRALAVNITALGAASAGYLTAWDGEESTFPTTSTLNFTPGKVVPNMAIVPVANCSECQSDMPRIGIYNGSAGPVHVLVDVVGVYDDGVVGDGLRYRALAPTRIVDTRQSMPVGTIGPGATAAVTAPAAVAGTDTYALITNATAIAPTASTYLTLYPEYAGEPRPPVSNLNATAGQIVANATATELGSRGVFNIFNAAGNTNVAVDVNGSLDLSPAARTSDVVPTSLPSLVPSRARPAVLAAVAHPQPPGIRRLVR